MKIIFALLIIFSTPQLILAEEANYSTKIQSDISLGSFESSDFQWQCGCWYYYPFEKKEKGDLMINFEYGTDSAFIVLDGKKHRLGNWESDSIDGIYKYEFNGGDYTLSIMSKIIRSGKYSSDYESEVKFKTKDKVIEFKAYGSCGC